MLFSPTYHSIAARAGGILILTFLPAVRGHANPELTSWYTEQSGKYARAYKTTTNRTNGVSFTTWTNHDSPAYSDVYQISYNASNVYVKQTGLPSYIIGPWPNDMGGNGNLWPETQSSIRRFPRSPVVQGGTKDSTNAADSGLFVNGVAIFNSLDGKAWTGTAMQGQSEHFTSDDYWHQNAPVAESFNFDYALGHQTPGGYYHNHQNPIALRYQLGDHVTYNATTKAYTESAGLPSEHSPIVGWAYDGYPVYGPYGYDDPTDSGSGIRRMVGGYVKRDGTTAGVDSVITNNGTIPAWYARYRQAHFGESYSTTTAETRSTNTGTYPVGNFAQDWAYLGDLIKTGATYYQHGVDFDLNEYNARFCVTPEYPSGTWAYFVSIDASGGAVYPYVLGFEYVGDETGGTAMSVPGTATTYFTGGPNTPLTVNSTPTVSSGTVTVVWNAVEGGTYSVDASTDNVNWTNQESGLTANDITEAADYTALTGFGTEYVRIQRTALATYDTTGVGSATVSQSTTASYSTGSAPTLTTVGVLGGATEDTAFAITYTALADAANEADADGDAISFRVEALSGGTLTEGGSAVTPGASLLSAGETWVWTPASNANGNLNAFTITAFDGAASSSTPVQVVVNVAAVNDPPTLTTISTLGPATEETAFPIAFATLAAAADEADIDSASLSFRVASVTNGSLEKGGSPVTPGTTTLAIGETLTWTPATNATGTVGAFTVVAYDGADASATPITVNVSVTNVNDAPTLTSVSTLNGATEDTVFAVTFAALAAAADEADPDGDALFFEVIGISTGTATKNGEPFSSGNILAGETIFWTPDADANGTLSAFTIRASDGTLLSSTDVTVSISVAAVNDPPTLTAIADLTGATEDAAFQITYAALAAAADESDPDGTTPSFRVESVTSGTLTKNGSAVVPGVTTLGIGETWVWTGAPQAYGTLPAFTVKAYDGSAASSAAVQVNVVATAESDTVVWGGGAGTGDWGTPGNWTQGFVPDTLDVPNFTGGLPSTIALGADRSHGAVFFGGSTAYTIQAGNTLGITGGIIVSNGAGAASHTIAADVAFDASASATLFSSTTLTLSGNVSGGALALSGGGVMVITGSATFTGTTTVSSGTLRVGDSTTTGFITGAIEVQSGALLEFKRTTGYAHASPISGAGGVRQSGTTTLNLTGDNTFTGALTVASGNVAIGIAGGSTGSIATETVTNNGNLIFNRSIDYAYAGDIGGTGSLFKVGSNTLTLTGDNTYSGNTHIQEGILVFSSLSNLGNGPGYLRFGGGTLRWSSGNTDDISARQVRIEDGGARFDTNGNDVTLVNAVGNSGTGTFFKLGEGTLTLGSTPTHTGSNTISAGTLKLINGATLVGDITNNAALIWEVPTSTVYGGTISGDGQIAKTGNGTFGLSGQITGSPKLTVSAGTFSSASLGLLSDTMDIALDSGATLHLDFEGTEVIDELTFDGEPVFIGTWGGIGSGAQNIDSRITGTGLLRVTTGVPTYQSWAESKGLTASNDGFDFDADADGLDNGLEMVFGGDPLDADDSAGLLPVSTFDGQDLTLTFNRSDESELTIEVIIRYGSELPASNSVMVGSSSSVEDDIVITVEENGEEADSITVRIPVDANLQFFAQLLADDG